jgi:hypothetical protein
MADKKQEVKSAVVKFKLIFRENIKRMVEHSSQ